MKEVHRKVFYFFVPAMFSHTGHVHEATMFMNVHEATMSLICKQIKFKMQSADPQVKQSKI